MPEPTAIDTVEGLAALADRYDGFVLDIWGVLYDGGPAGPGVVPCMEALKARGKRVVLLSNSPRRVTVLDERMAGIGIGRALYHAAHSSGEETFDALRDRVDPFFAGLGRRYAETGPTRFKGLLDGLDLERVAVEEADFLLASGPEDPRHTIADYRGLLDRALARALPMICANPDLEVVDSGLRQICAGSIGAEYQRKGGAVRYLGKPHPEVYRATQRLLGIEDPSRVLMVGDTLWTDVRGAATVGFKSLLIASGIHAERIGFDGEDWNTAALTDLLVETGDRPDHVAAWFRWDKASVPAGETPKPAATNDL